MKFSFKDFFCTCEEIRRKFQICSYLLKQILEGKFYFLFIVIESIWDYLGALFACPGLFPDTSPLQIS